MPELGISEILQQMKDVEKKRIAAIQEVLRRREAAIQEFDEQLKELGYSQVHEPATNEPAGKAPQGKRTRSNETRLKMRAQWYIRQMNSPDSDKAELKKKLEDPELAAMVKALLSKGSDGSSPRNKQKKPAA